MKDLIFALLLHAGEGEADALRLARSIRTFGGMYCFNPIWMLSQSNEDELTDETRQQLYSIGARLVTFEAGSNQPTFAFKTYVSAAAIAEGLAQGETSCLVFMASDTLILQEPAHFILPIGKSFGGCPVHLKLLGSGFDEPLDDFWSLVYSKCSVDQQKVFAMQTIVDEQWVRPYFNAGMLVVRPERGLLRCWQSNFERMYQLPEVQQFCRRSELYEIFFHQAVLAGSLLSSLHKDELHQLPLEVNYPLHLHSRMAVKRRPSEISQLISCRYEEFSETFSDPSVQELLSTDQALKAWLLAGS